MCGRWSCRAAFSPFPWKKICASTPRFLRHIRLIGEVLKRFQPDLIHITGPSDVGILGAWLAHHNGLPLAASWHTNVHEYAARRSGWFLRLLPKRQAAATGQEDREFLHGCAGQIL